MENKNIEKLMEEAAQWSARACAPDFSESEREQLQRWLQDDPAHADAFAAARLVSDGLRELTRLDPRLSAMADEAYAMGTAAGSTAARPLPRFRPRWVIGGGLAAVLAIFTLLGQHGAMPGSGGEPAAQIYAAGDSVRQVLLEDGSQLSLDTGARVSVQLGAHERRLQLLSGRVLFEVAHDRNRPFSVDAKGLVTTALGTRFQVDIAPDDAVSVVLSEGSVKVDQRLDQGIARSTRLRPGQAILAAARGEADWIKQDIDAEVATSWSRGRLVFRATPLAQAVAEINRYSKTRLVIADPALSDLAVSGNFIPGDGAAIAAAFAEVLPLRVVESGGELVLFLRHAHDPDG